MRRLWLLAILALALPAAGTAAFPGTNGRLLFVQELEQIDRYLPPGNWLCSTTPAAIRPGRLVEAPAAQAIEHPAVDAAGDRIAYSRIGSVFMSFADGRGNLFLTSGTMPAWEPDGIGLFVAERGDLYRLRPLTAVRRAFIATPAYEQSPAVSPDGERVAYVRGSAVGVTGDELVVREIGTGVEHVLVASSGIASPDWSPDGARIAFALGSTIATVSAGGGGLRTLATGTVGEPAYSPDGALIAFERDGDVWTTSAASGDGLRNVTRSPVRERQPVWQTGTARTPADSERPCAIVGTDGPDELAGSEFADVVYDLGGDDVVHGLGGDDLVYDGPGIDRHEGGDGNDTILLREGANTVLAGAGDDVVTALGGVFVNVPVPVPQRILGEDGADVLTGGGAADRIEGGPGKDVLNGLAGPDALFGGTEPDRLVGNRGDDVLFGNQGDDVLYGGLTGGLPRNYDGYDLLNGGEGNDRLAGGWQKDRLFGGPGDDRLAGGQNADHLVGEAGVDLLTGEAGDDLLLARDGRRESVYGGPGLDRARVDRSDRRFSVERLIR